MARPQLTHKKCRRMSEAMREWQRDLFDTMGIDPKSDPSLFCTSCGGLLRRPEGKPSTINRYGIVVSPDDDNGGDVGRTAAAKPKPA